MKKRSTFSRIVSFALAFVLVLTSMGFNSVHAYAKETDSSLPSPVGGVATYDESQGIGFVWGNEGKYSLYTVTIESANGYSRVYENQNLAYHWYPDTYPAGTYDVYVQGEWEDVLSPEHHAAPITIGASDDAGAEGSSDSKESKYVNFELLTTKTYFCQEDATPWGNSKNVTFSFAGDKATVTGEVFGGAAWEVQWQLGALSATADVNALVFDVTTENAGTLKYKFAAEEGMEDVALVAGENHVVIKTEKKSVEPFFDLSFLGAGANVFANMEFVNSVADPVDDTVKIVPEYDALDLSSVTVMNAQNENELKSGTATYMETYQSDGWGGNASVNFGFDGAVATISSENFGWNAWAVQWKLVNLSSATDKNIFEFDVVCDKNKTFNYKNENTGVMTTITLEAGKNYHFVELINSDKLNVTYDLTGGSGELKFYNVKFVPVIDLQNNIVFDEYKAEDNGNWAGDKNVKFAYNDTVATISADSFGWNAWGVQWKAALESTKDKNTLEFDVLSTEDKTIIFKDETKVKEYKLKLIANVPYHYSENVDSNKYNFVFDLHGGAGTLKISNMKFGDASLTPIKKASVADKMYDFKDTTGDVADPGLSKDGYTLIWADEFDGNYGDAKVDANTGLNLENWAYQYGDGTLDCNNYGWGNNELQAYTGNSKNIGVNEDLTGDGNADGLLRITASYEENGYKYESESSKKYTSARIRTTSKDEALFTTTYGYVEARISLPEVKGAWPAFWMLPESTDIYGGWPVSGEIDILETTGTQEKAACGTLHWGTPVHVYRGSDYVTLDSEVKYFHTYAIDWEPGKISWIYDGKVVHTATDWTSAFNGASDSLSFDAPFDMPFYMLLNLAVDSGNFGGSANKANFKDDINMYVDYVRVFQKEAGYADSVARGSSEANADWTELAGKNQIAEITKSNLVTSGLDDANSDNGSWYLALQEDASATASVYEDENGKVWDKLSISKQGGNDYSVQLIGHYDAKKGYAYKVSFDAYATGAMVGKTVNADTKRWGSWSAGGSSQVKLASEPTHYSFKFIEDTTFDKCRVEFNIGAVATGDVYISNVVVEIIDPATLGEAEGGRQPLAGGNIIYNSSFEEGTGHLGFWTAGAYTKVSVPRYTTKDLTGSDVKVMDVASKTNYEKISDGIKYYERRAEIESVNGAAPSIIQSEIPMDADDYTVTFEMYSENDTYVKVSVLDEMGNEVAAKMASYSAKDGLKDYTFDMTVPKDIESGSLKLSFAKGANVMLDDVKMIGANYKPSVSENPINKDTEWGADTGAGQAMGLDKIENGFKVAGITSTGSGDSEWYKPQIVSADFALAAAFKYQVSFKIRIDAGQSGNGKFKYIVQNNGNLGGDWRAATDVVEVALSSLSVDDDGFAVYSNSFVSGESLENARLIFGFGNADLSNATVTIKDCEVRIVKESSGEISEDSSEDGIDESVFDNSGIVDEKEEGGNSGASDEKEEGGNSGSSNEKANEDNSGSNSDSENNTNGNAVQTPAATPLQPVLPVIPVRPGAGAAIGNSEEYVDLTDALTPAAATPEGTDETGEKVGADESNNKEDLSAPTADDEVKTPEMTIENEDAPLGNMEKNSVNIGFILIIAGLVVIIICAGAGYYFSRKKADE